MCCNDDKPDYQCIACIDSAIEREGAFTTEPVQDNARFFDRETKTERIERMMKGWKKKISPGGSITFIRR
jgi:hypothetical protein